jgi:putative phage-type endonuclease
MYLNDLETLENIFDSIVALEDDPLIMDDDMLTDFIETTLEQIYEYVNENPTLISDPEFHSICVNEIRGLCLTQFEEQILLNELYEEELYNYIDEAFEIFYSSIFPRRSFDSSIIITTPNITVVSDKIQHLLNQPQHVQRSPEWYTFRHNLITASNAHKIFDSICSQNQLIYEKCQPIPIIANIPDKEVNVNSTLHWGQKYEPLSVMVYEDKYNTEIKEFGCIKHTNYDFLGASPDGINVKIDSPRYGRMLEVKNIVNRVIDGVPKKEYWIQMQLQLEICNLDECDFLETKFVEYENETDFMNDGNDFLKSKIGETKGIIMYFSKNSGVPVYIYKPLHMDKSEFDIWEAEQMSIYSDMEWIKNIHWKLEKYSCVLVLRNNMWFKSNISEIQKLWNTIINERISGYEHRAPTRKQKKEEIDTNCLLSINKDTGKVEIVQYKIITETLEESQSNYYAL